MGPIPLKAQWKVPRRSRSRKAASDLTLDKMILREAAEFFRKEVKGFPGSQKKGGGSRTIWTSTTRLSNPVANSSRRKGV